MCARLSSSFMNHCDRRLVMLICTLSTANPCIVLLVHCVQHECLMVRILRVRPRSNEPLTASILPQQALRVVISVVFGQRDSKWCGKHMGRRRWLKDQSHPGTENFMEVLLIARVATVLVQLNTYFHSALFCLRQITRFLYVYSCHNLIVESIAYC